ncbi:MAG: hypothetical protein AAF597_08185, partial [Bacteroidota bacterium]
ACEQDDRANGGGEVLFLSLTANATYYVRSALVEATTGDEVITTSIEYVEEVTWTAAQNAFWDDPNNWSPARVPTAEDKVIIPADASSFCLIRTIGGVDYAAAARMIEIEGNSLQVTSGTSLTIANGTTGILITGALSLLTVSGELTVQNMTGDGINLTDGVLIFDGGVQIENIGDDGLQSTNGQVLSRKELTIRNVADNGMVIDGGLAALRQSSTVTIEDITDHGITVFGDGELFAQGELIVQRVGRDGITTDGGRLEITENGNVSITTAGEFGLADANFVNNGILSIDGTGNDGIDTDLGCTNNGQIFITDAGDDGLDIQDDSTFVNNGYLESANNTDRPVADGKFHNGAGGELVFSGAISSEMSYANGSRLGAGPGLGLGTLSSAPVLDSVTLVVDIEGPPGGLIEQNDVLLTLGDFDLADSKLELQGSYVPTVGETFEIISASGGSILNTFEGLPEGSTLVFNGVELQITYLGGGSLNQDVELTAISLPTFTWTGAEDTDWNNVNNWSTGAVPSLLDKVVIPATANDPIIDIGFTNAGAVTVDGAMLTVAEGSLLNVADLEGGLTIDGGGRVDVNGSLAIQGQQNTGLKITDGILVVGATGDMTVDNTFAEVTSGFIDGFGELTITNAPADGIHVLSGALIVGEAGSLQIDAAVGDGLIINEGAGFRVSGTADITNNGGDGLSIGAGNDFRIEQTGQLTITNNNNRGIFLADATTQVNNDGLFTLYQNTFACEGGVINTSAGATLRVAGDINSEMIFAAGGRFEPGDGVDCTSID